MQILIGLFLFIFSGWIYLVFRPTTLLMFSWFKKIGIYDQILFLRSSLNFDPNFIGSEILIYSLPFALWVSSFMLIMDSVWESQKIKWVWIFSIPIAAILSELGQLFGIVTGSFDIADLLTLSLITIITFFYLNRNNA